MAKHIGIIAVSYEGAAFYYETICAALMNHSHNTSAPSPRLADG